MSETVARIDNTLVLKVGTTVMFKNEDGREVLDHDSFNRIGEQILRYREDGSSVGLVSSGAVTAGMEVTGTAERPTGEEAMPEIQALAALGWHHVVNSWERALGGVPAGGILLTRRELNPETPEHDEALRTAHTLLYHGWIPTFNENDPVTHGELSHESFGQNDEISALLVAQMAFSKLFGKNLRLILLSDVDGVYRDVNDKKSIIREIKASEIDSYAHLAGGSNSKHSKGGMISKFKAGKIATDAGVEMWVANGRTDDAIQLALDGTIGTHFTL